MGAPGPVKTPPATLARVKTDDPQTPSPKQNTIKPGVGNWDRNITESDISRVMDEGPMPYIMRCQSDEYCYSYEGDWGRKPAIEVGPYPTFRDSVDISGCEDTNLCIVKTSHQIESSQDSPNSSVVHDAKRRLDAFIDQKITARYGPDADLDDVNHMGRDIQYHWGGYHTQIQASALRVGLYHLAAKSISEGYHGSLPLDMAYKLFKATEAKNEEAKKGLDDIAHPPVSNPSLGEDAKKLNEATEKLDKSELRKTEERGRFDGTVWREVIKWIPKGTTLDNDSIDKIVDKATNDLITDWPPYFNKSELEKPTRAASEELKVLLHDLVRRAKDQSITL